MSGLEAMQAVVSASGKSKRGISLACGRSETFLSSTIRQASKPTADTLALVAQACGYTLALIPTSEELPAGAIVIDRS